MTNVLSLSNIASKNRITIGTSTEHVIKVYFLNQIQSLIPSNDFFFKECNEVKKKGTFDNKVDVMLNKNMLPDQS